jgi:alpha-ketoglutaric semialdehyde dehydrogenase
MEVGHQFKLNKMLNTNTDKKIYSWINGKEHISGDKSYFQKLNPHNLNVLSNTVISSEIEIDNAIDSAKKSFPIWSSFTPIRRGKILYEFVNQIINNKEFLAKIVAKETGKVFSHALGEVEAAISVGQFFAGEGQRLYSRSLTSGMENKHSHTVREPLGICGLIVPANTPIANITWKIFPALICGNSVVLKGSEDSPEIAFELAKLSKIAGIPDGVINTVNGFAEAGKLLVNDPRISLISFTGSTVVGKYIAENAGKRLARVSLELGGKNPLIICDDADLENAVNWCSLSAFSNAGQRCASGSRIIIFSKIYDRFIEKFLKKAQSLKLGISDDSDLGPVINLKQFNNILDRIKEAKNDGAKILCGGKKSESKDLKKGLYIEPTIISDISKDAYLSRNEIFGPVVTLYKVNSVDEALELANDSDYGLTSSVHTKNVDRATWFSHKIRAGVVNINIGTYGSEPHMPFGGFGNSGNGTREPGTEAIDVYSELKNIQILVRENLI